MSTRSGFERIDTEQTVEHLAVIGVAVLTVVIGAVYVGHQLTELILAMRSALQV